MAGMIGIPEDMSAVNAIGKMTSLFWSQGNDERGKLSKTLTGFEKVIQAFPNIKVVGVPETEVEYRVEGGPWLAGLNAAKGMIDDFMEGFV